MYNSLDPITDWYNQDDRIKSTLDRLSSSGLSEEEQAAAAFEELSSAFQLRKYHEDLSDATYSHFDELEIDDPRSVFEEFCIIRYLEPDDDPRGVVMMALYNVYKGIQMPLNECARKHYGGKRKIPKQYMVCYIGEGIKGRLYFLNEGESWVELGARAATKVIR
jgi:hypothetical protein